MSDHPTRLSDLSAADQAAHMVREAAQPIVAGTQIKAQINKAAMVLGIRFNVARRIWYREANMSADKFINLQIKYQKFKERRNTAAYDKMSGEFALLKSTQNQLECAADEKQNLQDDIKDLREAITCLGEAITRLSEQDRR